MAYLILGISLFRTGLDPTLIPSTLIHPVSSRDHTRWEKPPAGWYKLNTDASVSSNASATGLGFILRDSMGVFVAAKSVYLPGTYQVIDAEALAIREGLMFVKHLGIEAVQVESDAQQVIQGLKSFNLVSSLDLVMEDIRKLATVFPNVSLLSDLECGTFAWMILFWCRKNAIRLEEKEKEEMETRNPIIEEGEEYKEAFYEKRKLNIETNKTNNKEKEKEKSYLENQEKFHKEADKQYWKAIAELIPNEVPNMEKKGERRIKDAKDAAKDSKDSAPTSEDPATIAIDQPSS